LGRDFINDIPLSVGANNYLLIIYKMGKLTNSQCANIVRKKEVRKDRFYTPESLVRTHLAKFIPDAFEGLTIYEPFAGKGAYLSLFPEYFPKCNYASTEIDEGTDFFEYAGKCDIIISNPPFSILKQVFERMYELKPQIISLVLNQHAVTPCRIREANQYGYFVADYHLTRVDKWFGVACILTLTRDITENCIRFDTVKHRLMEQSPPATV